MELNTELRDIIVGLEMCEGDYEIECATVTLPLFLAVAKKHGRYQDLVDLFVDASYTVVDPAKDPNDYYAKLKAFADYLLRECPDAREPLRRELEDRDPSLAAKVL